MKVSENLIKKLQEGGQMPAEPMAEPAPAAPQEGQGGEDPITQIIMAAAQAVQSNDGQMALQVCAALVQLAQGAQGGQEPAPAEPVMGYRSGGKLVVKRRLK